VKLKPLVVGAALALALFVTTAGTASAQNYYRGGNGGYRVNGYNYYGPRYTNNNYRPYSNGFGYGYTPYYAPAVYSPVFSQGYYGSSFGYNRGFGGYNPGFGGFNSGFGGYPGYGYGGSGFSFSIGGFR